MIIGSMVIHNEKDRYLQAALCRLQAACDKVFVADDQSEDDGIELAESMGCFTWARPDNVPSFQESESKFRQAAWDQMSKQLKLKETDWVLSIDADECFLGDKAQMKALVKMAGHRRCFSAPIPEVWESDPLQIRVDGFWRGNCNRRIQRFDKVTKFRDIGMGCGSVPMFEESTVLSMKLGILHFGYADQEDRVRKHAAYTALANHGHNQNHIDSIISKPKLEHLDINVDFWRGVR